MSTVASVSVSVYCQPASINPDQDHHNPTSFCRPANTRTWTRCRANIVRKVGTRPLRLPTSASHAMPARSRSLRRRMWGPWQPPHALGAMPAPSARGCRPTARCVWPESGPGAARPLVLYAKMDTTLPTTVRRAVRGAAQEDINPTPDKQRVRYV